MSLANRKSLAPWIKDSIEYYEHQTTGVRQMARMRSAILADDMGLGKTLQMLTVFGVDLVRRTKDNKRYSEKMLVVAPVSLKPNWAEEIEAFCDIPFMVLEGTPTQRVTQLMDFMDIKGPKILIVNYEQVEGHLQVLNNIKFDIVALDEAHAIQNPKAKRTKAVHQLYRVRSFALTGSPMLNQVDGLWSILNFVEPGQWMKHWDFKKRYCVYGGYQDKQIIGVKNENELKEKLQRVMIRRLKSEVLDLPEVQYVTRTVGMTALQRKMYDEVKEEMRLTPAAGVDPVAVDNALVKFLRLKQICGTTKAIDGCEEDSSEKLDQAVQDALEIVNNGHKIVVFTQFREVQKAFVARLEEALDGRVPVYQLHGGIEKGEPRQEVLRAWKQAPGASVMVGMIQVIGVGMNMTEARHGMFLDKVFTPMLNQQAVDRLNRIGADTTQPIQILEYRVRGSVEARVEAILKTKKDLFDNVVEDKDSWKKRLVEELEADAA